MHRQKGTRNTPQTIVDEIIDKHVKGSSNGELAVEYGKFLKTIRNLITQENNKISLEGSEAWDKISGYLPSQRERRSPRSCNSTVTKGFNQSIFQPDSILWHLSRRNVFTERNLKALPRPGT